MATTAVLAFPGLAAAAVTSSVAGGALTATADAGDAIAVTCVGGQVKINGADPGAAAACDTLTSITVNGGPGANTLDLSGVTAAAFPKVTAVTVNGGAGNDKLIGSELADRLIGGDNDDDVTGLAGDDTLVWNPGDDSDRNEGDLGVDTIEVNGGNGGEQFTVKPSATPRRVQFDRTGPTPPGPFTLDIGSAERLDMNANGGDDTFTADAGLDALGFKLDVDGGAGNDSLDGGDGADLINGGDGDDRIVPDDNPANTRDDARGGAGNDTIVWNGGDDDDLNEGGDGTDTIEVNGAAAGEQFTVKPSPTAGRVIFDRTGPNPPGPFNIDIGTAERLDLNANGGDDTVTADPGFSGLAMDVDGGDGNDSLDGGDAADVLAGGNGNDRLVGDDNPAGTRDVVRGDAGDDTMVWNPGDDDDVNDGGDGNDVAEVNGGAGPEQFTVKPSATPGRVAFDRTGPTPPGPFNVDIGSTESLVLNAGGGDDRITGATGLAGLIRSTLNGDDGNDLIQGTDGQDSLNGGAGQDAIRSRDTAEDLVDCGAGFDAAKVDKRDFVRGCNLVIGGASKVRLAAKALTARKGVVALPLRCVGAARCAGVVELRSGGRTLARKAFAITGRAKTVRVKLNSRGRKLAAAGRTVDARIDVRDELGNGWRSTQRLKIKR